MLFMPALGSLGRQEARWVGQIRCLADRLGHKYHFPKWKCNDPISARGQIRAAIGSTPRNVRAVEHLIAFSGVQKLN